MSKIWQAEEKAKLVELWNGGVSLCEICSKLCRTRGSVDHQLRELRNNGLVDYRNKPAKWTPEMDADVLRLWLEGKGGSEISASLGLSPRQVWNRMQRLRKADGVAPRRRKEPRVCSFADVRAVVLNIYRTTMDELASPSRSLRVLEPRQVLMCVGYKYSGLSLPQIGERFGRDHTTVLHAVKIAPIKYQQAVANIEAQLFHREAAE